MVHQSSRIWAKLGMDYELTPPWTSINMAQAINLGLLIAPDKERRVEQGQPFLMISNRATYQRKSWIPDAFAGKQVVFIPTSNDGTHPVPALIEEHKLYFNLCFIALMSMGDPEDHTVWDLHHAHQPNMGNIN